MGIEARSSFFDAKNPSLVLLHGHAVDHTDRTIGDVGLGMQALSPSELQVVAPALSEKIEQDGKIIHVPFSFDRQAEIVSKTLKEQSGPMIVFAHSQGGIPLIEVLTSLNYAQVAPEHSFFAGTPLRPETEQERIARLMQDGPSLEHIQDHLPPVAAIALEGIVHFQKTHERPYYVAVTADYMKSFTSFGRHVLGLQELMMNQPSTIFVAGDEKVTDCTPENIATVLPEVAPVNYSPEIHDASVIILPGANHRFGGKFRQEQIPQAMMQRIISQLGKVTLQSRMASGEAALS